MDTKRTIVFMLLIVVLGLGYQYFLAAYVYPKHPEWMKPVPTASTTQSSAPALVSTNPVDLTGSDQSKPNPDWKIVPTSQPAAATIGSDVHKDAQYHQYLSLVPAGASIDSVVLNQYLQEADQPELFTFQNSFLYEDPTSHYTTSTHSMETLAVIIDDATSTPVKTGDAAWTLINRTPDSATFVLNLTPVSGKGHLQIQKQYVLTKATTDPNTPQGYEVAVNYLVNNDTDKPHSVALRFAGPTIPHAETARQDTEIVAGLDDDGLIKLDLQALSAIGKGEKAKIFAPEPMLWVGASSNYFNAFVRLPKEGQLASAVAEAVNPDSPADQRLVRITLTTKDLNSAPLAPNGSAALDLSLFFGPKLRPLLNSKYYATFPRGYDQTLVMISGCWLYAFCTSATLINFLVALLAGMHYLFGDWGLAIIALVCVVRIILHPLTKRSQVSMLKMQKMAPKLEILKKKYGDDKDGFARAQMELYKEVGFSPFLGCAPMFLQTPIFIALWRALQTTFELRQAPFLYFFGHHFTWIHDLSQPDALVKFATPIPLFIFGWHLSAINVLPLAMAVVTFINQKYFTPKPAAVTPEQQQQQKMMVWMTLMFPVMFYTFPSGLNLYYLTSTSLGILESRRVRAHIKAVEAAEAGKGPVIVDAGKLSRSARRREKPEPPAAKGFWAKLQERAEEIARDQEKKKRKGN